MAGATVKIPGMGEQKSSTVMIVGGAAVVIIGYYLYRQHQNTVAAASTTDTALTNTTTIDPATGYPYGSAEDTALLNAQQVQGVPGDYYGSGYGGGSGGGGSTGGGSTANDITSNPQWEQVVLQYVPTHENVSHHLLGIATSRYLTGEDLDADQKRLVEMAIAAEGFPPQAGPNNYPPNIREKAGGGQQEKKLGTPKLRVTHRGTTGPHAKARHTGDLAWSRDPHATSYTVHEASGKVYKTVKGTSVKNAPAGKYYVIATAGTQYKRSDPSNTVTI